MLIPYDIHDERYTELNDNPEFPNASGLASRLQVRTVCSMSLGDLLEVLCRVSYIYSSSSSYMSLIKSSGHKAIGLTKMDCIVGLFSKCRTLSKCRTFSPPAPMTLPR